MSTVNAALQRIDKKLTQVEPKSVTSRRPIDLPAACLAALTRHRAVQETEREKLRVMMNQYQQKAALLADLLQQQAAVAQADNQYQQALAGFWTAKAGFDRALGKD